MISWYSSGCIPQADSKVVSSQTRSSGSRPMWKRQASPRSWVISCMVSSVLMSVPLFDLPRVGPCCQPASEKALKDVLYTSRRGQHPGGVFGVLFQEGQVNHVGLLPVRTSSPGARKVSLSLLCSGRLLGGYKNKNPAHTQGERVAGFGSKAEVAYGLHRP